MLFFNRFGDDFVDEVTDFQVWKKFKITKISRKIQFSISFEKWSEVTFDCPQELFLFSWKFSKICSPKKIACNSIWNGILGSSINLQFYVSWIRICCRFCIFAALKNRNALIKMSSTAQIVGFFLFENLVRKSIFLIFMYILRKEGTKNTPKDGQTNNISSRKKILLEIFAERISKYVILLFRLLLFLFFFVSFALFIRAFQVESKVLKLKFYTRSYEIKPRTQRPGMGKQWTQTYKRAWPKNGLTKNNKVTLIFFYCPCCLFFAARFRYSTCFSFRFRLGFLEATSTHRRRTMLCN